MTDLVKKHRLTMLALAVIFAVLVAGGLFTLSKDATTQAQTSPTRLSLNTAVSFPVDI